MANLLDPTAEFIKAIRKDARKRGDKIAKRHYEGDMAVAMGEVYSDLLFELTIGRIGNSLYDVPMQAE